MATSFAGCCHPIPGDPIVGVVRTGRGVVIHRSDCRILARKADEADRWLDLGWNQEIQDAKAVARLHIMTTNQPGSLGSLSTVVGKQAGNITDVRFGSRTPDLYEIILDIEVKDREHLDRIVASLRATSVVSHVERTQG
jgi:GTP pyrophosphokinase